MFSKKVLPIMISSGWTPERRINIDNPIELLNKEGYMVHEKAKSFFINFNNLLIEFPSPQKEGTIDTINLNLLEAIESVSHNWVIENYSNRTGNRLCLIGQVYRDYMNLSMDENGKVYAGFDDMLLFIGDTGTQAIENICIEKEFLKIS